MPLWVDQAAFCRKMGAGFGGTKAVDRLKKNDFATVYVEDMNNFGYGVGHIDGKAVFISDGVTGEKLRVKIIKDAGSYFVARREETEEVSERRAPSPCTAFPRCGGCSFCHLRYEYEKELKGRFVSSFLQKAGLSDLRVLPVLSTDKPFHYRNKIQYPYKDGALGYYAPHSHRVIPNDGCLLHRPAAEPVLRDVAAFLREKRVESYDEETGRGYLRHVCLRVNGDGGQMMLILVANGGKCAFARELLALLHEKHSCVKSVYLNVQKEKSNVIFGEKFLLLDGKETITDTLLGCAFEISPASFYQVNRDACELLYGEVIRQADLRGGERLVDLFCGIGAIGICLASRTDIRLTGVEIVPQAVENARRNAERNGIKNAEFFCGDANHPALKSADAVIVDPPRKGLDEALVAHLSSLPALQKIVYVSCGPDTLARDLARFRAQGWQIGDLQPVDMFPKTGHVETVVRLSRQ